MTDPVLEALTSALRMVEVRISSQEQIITNATRELTRLNSDKKALECSIITHTEK